MTSQGVQCFDAYEAASMALTNPVTAKLSLNELRTLCRGYLAIACEAGIVCTVAVRQGDVVLRILAPGYRVDTTTVWNSLFPGMDMSRFEGMDGCVTLIEEGVQRYKKLVAIHKWMVCQQFCGQV